MALLQVQEFRPDFVSPPGTTLLDVLETRSMSQAELAERTGRPLKTINEIVKGKSAITTETALQFERVLGIIAEFWNQRESSYRTHLTRLREYEELGGFKDWVSNFPIGEMIKNKIIKPPENSVSAQVISILNFFGVASPDQWKEVWASPKLAFRKSSKLKTKVESTAVWLRQGEIEAQQVNCAPYSREKLVDMIPALREMSQEDDPQIFLPRLRDMFAACGVAIVIVPALVNVPVYGAARWLNPQKALIQLSLRGKSNDLFWFTLFHEIVHILNHSKKELFVEIERSDIAKSKEEEEADRLGSEYLLPKDIFTSWANSQTSFEASNIKKFARDQGIAPGIIVGRLQFEKRLVYKTKLNDLKVHYEWDSE